MTFRAWDRRSRLSIHHFSPVQIRHKTTFLFLLGKPWNRDVEAVSVNPYGSHFSPIRIFPVAYKRLETVDPSTGKLFESPLRASCYWLSSIFFASLSRSFQWRQNHYFWAIETIEKSFNAKEEKTFHTNFTIVKERIETTKSLFIDPHLGAVEFRA